MIWIHLFLWYTIGVLTLFDIILKLYHTHKHIFIKQTYSFIVGIFLSYKVFFLKDVKILNQGISTKIILKEVYIYSVCSCSWNNLSKLFMQYTCTRTIWHIWGMSFVLKGPVDHTWQDGIRFYHWHLSEPVEDNWLTIFKRCFTHVYSLSYNTRGDNALKWTPQIMCRALSLISLFSLHVQEPRSWNIQWLEFKFVHHTTC